MGSMSIFLIMGNAGCRFINRKFPHTHRLQDENHRRKDDARGAKPDKYRDV